MTLKCIEQEEWWPVLRLSDESYYGRTPLDVPDELLKRYEQCMVEFTYVQKELRKIYESDK